MQERGIWQQYFTPSRLSSLPPHRAFKRRLGRVPVIEGSPMFDNYGPGALLEKQTRLYDLTIDPRQETALQDPARERWMLELMKGPHAIKRCACGSLQAPRTIRDVSARTAPASISRRAFFAGVHLLFESSAFTPARRRKRSAAKSTKARTRAETMRPCA
jgi:hypothetical protein